MTNKKQMMLGGLLLSGIFLLTMFSLTTFDVEGESKTSEILRSTFEESVPLVTANATPPCEPGEGGSGGGHCP